MQIQKNRINILHIRTLDGFSFTTIVLQCIREMHKQKDLENKPNYIYNKPILEFSTIFFTLKNMEELQQNRGLQILTYAQPLWPLSSQGSLASYIYCDTGHPFIMAISVDP